MDYRQRGVRRRGVVAVVYKVGSVWDLPERGRRREAGCKCAHRTGPTGGRAGVRLEWRGGAPT